MLRFFRQIRRKLIRDSKARSYLFYAIGEIALVMIGILLALQVNNWNEQRKTVNKKNELLQNISAELIKDLDQLKLILSDIKVKNGNGTYLMSYFESEKEVSQFDLDRLRLGFMNTNDISELSPSRLAYEELVSTGSVNRIENDSLKQQLFDYYETSIREIGEFEQRYRYGLVFTDARFDYMENHILLEKVKSLTRQGDWKQDPFEDLNPDWEAMRAEGIFPMYLSRLLATQVMLMYDMGKTEYRIHEMIEQIQKETETD